MSFEGLSTIAQLVTATVISVTAIAALFQLRQMRAGNQISALMAIRGAFEDQVQRRAEERVWRELPRVMEDPAFRRWLTNPEEMEPSLALEEYIAIATAAQVVANLYEQCGILCKSGIIDETLFLDQYCERVDSTWKCMESYMALSRWATNDRGFFENFEYMTVRARRWTMRHSEGTFPKTMARIYLPDPPEANRKNE